MTATHCPEGHVWAIVQEPPIREFHWLRQGFLQFSRVFTPDVGLQGSRYVHSHGALPWHVKKGYDFLKACDPPPKAKGLSWITSNASRVKGHRRRMAFMKKVRSEVDFDLWGRGFAPIDDKWDGLAPYRYSLAVENCHAPYYWSEKLADCFLSWTMPIYYGCINIADYFPRESYVSIDIESRDAVKMVQEAVQSDLWLRNRDAIAYARELVLDRYQFFPFVVEQIRAFEQTSPAAVPQNIVLKALPWQMPEPFKKRLWWHVARAKNWARNRLKQLR